MGDFLLWCPYGASAMAMRITGTHQETNHPPRKAVGHLSQHPYGKQTPPNRQTCQVHVGVPMQFGWG
jgi:hypothetical protein